MSTFPQSLGADISLARTDPGHKRRSRRSEREQRSVALRFTQRDFGIACLNYRQVSGPALGNWRVVYTKNSTIVPIQSAAAGKRIEIQESMPNKAKMWCMIRGNGGEP